ncbi:MAG: hypothetical protein Q8Q14_09195 [Gemmatimonadales bacterium]|nr:hypothetical protein [Gemmatimonadales bacterium]
MRFGQTGPGYVNPIQPIGDAIAYTFLARTGWPTPLPAPTMRHALSDTVPGVSPATCAPKRPDFYLRFPGSYPSGPLDPYHEPWPTGSKPWPGTPIVSDGNGGFVAPQPQLPTTTRGVATTPSQALTNGETAALEMGGGGRGWFWLLLGIGLGYAGVMRLKGRA